MNLIIKISSFIVITIFLTGCTANTRTQNVGMGALIGGSMGGVTGTPFFILPGMAIGAVGGYVMESQEDAIHYKKPITLKEKIAHQ